MRVVYDFRIFSKQRYGGISRYFFELAKALYQSGNDAKILAPFYVNHYLRDESGPKFQGLYLPKLPGIAVQAVECSNVLLSNLSLSLRSSDILHETYYATHGLAARGSLVVTTVYDMMHEIFPHLYVGDDTAKLKAESVKRADHIFCISKKTQDDLIQILGVPAAKTSVTHLGCDFHQRAHEVAQSPLAEPYLLFVGPRGAHKNFKVFLTAYSMSEKLRRDFKVVCFGSLPFNEVELQLMDQLGVPRENILHATGGDDRLPTYYGNAELYVYPSLYEGFGLPPLEAMSLGCATVVSQAGSLPEVLGDATEYFESNNAESLRGALEKVAYSSERKNELRRLGSEKAAAYKWSRTAEQTLATYRKLLAK